MARRDSNDDVYNINAYSNNGDSNTVVNSSEEDDHAARDSNLGNTQIIMGDEYYDQYK